MPSLIFSRLFPTIRRSHPRSPSARSPTRKENNTSAPEAISSNYSRAFLRRGNGKRPCNRKLLSSDKPTTHEGMAATFQQLLKEYPKSAAAAQAHYYIGKAAFEAKDYGTAIGEMNKARQLSKDQYGNPATLRIMSSYFYLKQRDALAKEVNAFYSAWPNGQVPAEILEWLGLEFYNAKQYAPAAKYLAALSKTGNVSSVKPDFWFYLGDAQMKLNQPVEAEDVAAKVFGKHERSGSESESAPRTGRGKDRRAQARRREKNRGRNHGPATGRPGQCSGAIARRRCGNGAPAV